MKLQFKVTPVVNKGQAMCDIIEILNELTETEEFRI